MCCMLGIVYPPPSTLYHKRIHCDGQCACGMCVANIVYWLSSFAVQPHNSVFVLRLGGKVERPMASRSKGSIPVAVPPIRRRRRRKRLWWSGTTRSFVTKRSAHSGKNRQDKCFPTQRKYYYITNNLSPSMQIALRDSLLKNKRRKWRVLCCLFFSMMKLITYFMCI